MPLYMPLSWITDDKTSSFNGRNIQSQSIRSNFSFSYAHFDSTPKKSCYVSYPWGGKSYSEHKLQVLNNFFKRAVKVSIQKAEIGSDRSELDITAFKWIYLVVRKFNTKAYIAAWQESFITTHYNALFKAAFRPRKRTVNAAFFCCCWLNVKIVWVHKSIS